jgi:membrane-bound ClpP family serine protease
MEISIITLLILAGLVLLVVEIIFVPGTTAVGFLGFALMIAGCLASFKYYGSEGGWITVGISSVGSAVVFYFSFKAKVWNRFALKSSMKSTVNEGEMSDLQPGQEGIALSALRPVGKGEWNSRAYEVKTQGEYVERGTKIKIIKIAFNQIIVAPTT